jgi:hypothetical protein
MEHFCHFNSPASYFRISAWCQQKVTSMDWIWRRHSTHSLLKKVTELYLHSNGSMMMMMTHQSANFSTATMITVTAILRLESNPLSNTVQVVCPRGSVMSFSHFQCDPTGSYIIHWDVKIKKTMLELDYLAYLATGTSKEVPSYRGGGTQCSFLHEHHRHFVCSFCDLP